jgi:hypothetical protein
VIALHTAIKELEDEIENHVSVLNHTGASKKSELDILIKNCNSVLQQLNKKLIQYKSLGSASRRTWDRMKWSAGNLQEIREKLLAYTSSLMLFKDLLEKIPQQASDTIQSDHSDSDGDLEVEIVEALLRRGKERLEAEDFEGAERLLRNCSTRTTSSGPSSTLHRNSKS